MEDKKKFELVAKTAANWWAKKVWNTKFDNGESDRANVMAGMFATMLAIKDQSQISVEKQINFERILTESIIEKWNTTSLKYITIGCDYQPDRILCEAAKEAGISPNVFPWKTDMHIYEDRVEVKEGYGQPYSNLPLLRE